MASIEDVRAKAGQIDAALESSKETAKKGATLAGIGLFATILAVFLLGRRRGKSGKTVVEVYRG